MERRLWAHGVSGVVQNANGFLVEYLGYYLRLKADHDAEAWVHYPIAALEGDRCVGLRIRFQTWNGADAAAESDRSHESPQTSAFDSRQTPAVQSADLASARQSGGAIRALYFWDGPHLVASWDHLYLTAVISARVGSQARGPDFEEESWRVEPPRPLSGPASVSILVGARRLLDAIAIMGVALEFE